MQRSWVVYAALVAFALASAGQARASFDFTFGSSAVSFNVSDTVVCGATPAGSINMSCSWGGDGELALPVLPTTQILTAPGDALYFYLGSMYPNEGNGQLNGAGEAGAHNFRIDFAAASTAFSILVPATGATANAQSPFGTLTFGSGSQTVHLTAQPGDTLTGRILWSGEQHANSSSGHLSSNPGDLETQWQWTTNGPGNAGYMYLEMTYDNAGSGPAEVPEPATFVLLGSVLLGLGPLVNRRRKA